MDRGLPWWLRVLFVVVAAQALLLLAVFYQSELVSLLEPWPATPLNARFVASLYTALGLGVLQGADRTGWQRLALKLQPILIVLALLFLVFGFRAEGALFALRRLRGGRRFCELAFLLLNGMLWIILMAVLGWRGVGVPGKSDGGKHLSRCDCRSQPHRDACVGRRSETLLPGTAGAQFAQYHLTPDLGFPFRWTQLPDRTPSLSYHATPAFQAGPPYRQAFLRRPWPPL